MSLSDYEDAINGVSDRFEHRTLARTMMEHQVPLGTVAHINGWQFNQDMPTAGAYRYTDRSVRLQGKPSTMVGHPSAERASQARRLMVHEAHHATQHRLQPQQFETAIFDPQRRGRVEAYAENEADRRVPGSVSAYDRLVASGQNRRFSNASYLSTRSQPGMNPSAR
jgi:hypothetical protein